MIKGSIREGIREAVKQAPQDLVLGFFKLFTKPGKDVVKAIEGGAEWWENLSPEDQERIKNLLRMAADLLISKEIKIKKEF